ncbi:hypothetical protein [Pectobacterium brasiliense]|uniref:hypothetical protein n=1 Tax=Pectobacterium brasiliense TaxID=180957 RepID=UPI000C1BB16F|nr:hypothetical protein [Pectobacterium brasiliense]ATV43310.1 hypothetical protein CTV95_07500 [Pectobacterium brasiliense]MCA6982766.1 hypothetical protein [Pectobacterium brasiliense]MCH4992322.1 hypothetical protein [Pectobacterium brasiliense]
MQQQEFYEHSFEGLLGKYKDVCTWFTGLGFNYAVTRYGVYLKNIQKINEWSKGNNIFCNVKDEELVNFMKMILNSHIEANEIIRVYNDIKKLNNNEYIEQIKKVISGHELRATVENDQARDFLFELSTASRFLRAGYSVSLTGECDIVVDLPDGTLLFVECKRVKSIKKLAKNIKVAAQQLDKRIKDSGSYKNIGMVAVNITDLLPEISIHPSDNMQMVISYHRDLVRRFILNNIEDFASGHKKKIIGVMCESSISKLIASGGVAFSRHTGNIPYGASIFFEQLAPQLSNQDIT